MTPKRVASESEILELIQQLENRIQVLEDALLNYKQQMRYQLTKDRQLARDLGKKKE
jgi:exonuclease VII small subunit